MNHLHQVWTECTNCSLLNWVNYWLPEPWGPGKSYLGFRMFLILTQDVANMLVHMFSSKLEQLKAIIIRSIKRSWQNRWRRWAQIHKQGSEARQLGGSPSPRESCWSAPPVELCWSSSPRQPLLLSKIQTVKEVFLLKMKQTPKWVISGSPRDYWLLPTCQSLRGSQMMMPGRWSSRSTSFPENSYLHIS